MDSNLTKLLAHGGKVKKGEVAVNFYATEEHI